jgi:histidinol-phosphatase (PHP family)
VLTDYHVHLREDSDPRLAEEAALSDENVERYLVAAREVGVEELGVSEHVYRFRQALELWQHPFWREQARDDLLAYCEFVRASPLRLGLEVDFVPGAEDRTASLIDGCELDYVIGSVHFLDQGAVDHEGYDVWLREGDPDAVWRRYFATLAEAARSGLFDILAHPDLVKYWGRRRPSPDRDRRFYYEPAVEAIAESGVAVEVSTAGLRKPVGEIYPAPELAEMLVDAGAVFALSSDAHIPGDIGRDYDRAVEVMRGWGIEEIATFERRARTMETLG